MLKDINKDVNQVVLDNMYDILVTEFLTQWKDEQVAIVNSEVNNKLVQTSESEKKYKEKVQDIVSTMRRKVGEKIIHMIITFAHMNNVSFHSETSIHKWKYVFQRRIAAAEREREKEEGVRDK